MTSVLYYFPSGRAFWTTASVEMSQAWSPWPHPACRFHLCHDDSEFLELDDAADLHQLQDQGHDGKHLPLTSPQMLTQHFDIL